MSTIQKLKDLLTFPKYKTGSLSEYQWLALIKTSPFSGWKALSVCSHHMWSSNVSILQFCLFPNEEQAVMKIAQQMGGLKKPKLLMKQALENAN